MLIFKRWRQDVLEAWVVDTCTSLLGPEFISGIIDLLVEQEVLVGSQPKAETATSPQLLIKLSLLLCIVLVTVLLREVEVEATECLAAVLENILVTTCLLDPSLGLWVYLVLVHWQAEIGRSLKDGQVSDLGANLLNGLDTRSSSTDDCNLFTIKLNAFLWIDS
jgi:hypothetical protein